ncbi:hypothetical protein IPZ58_25260 [Streptomyces roseoverticillatus]|uniref:hypothetical protein n=1 Tax=Streptomyces roseoverticillatus TaxID=66429 RepID=UPI001F358B34|nr:hypothetical protein [Streptomyces roseoverticillatus]MCF3104875.1 hypothetical protein [Streptomyces roseoverticillatus]
MDAESENSGATIIPFPGAKGTGREHPAARPLRDLTWGDVDALLATTARSRSSSPSGMAGERRIHLPTAARQLRTLLHEQGLLDVPPAALWPDAPRRANASMRALKKS